MDAQLDLDLILEQNQNCESGFPTMKAPGKTTNNIVKGARWLGHALWDRIEEAASDVQRRPLFMLRDMPRFLVADTTALVTNPLYLWVKKSKMLVPKSVKQQLQARDSQLFPGAVINPKVYHKNFMEPVYRPNLRKSQESGTEDQPSTPAAAPGPELRRIPVQETKQLEVAVVDPNAVDGQGGLEELEPDAGEEEEHFIDNDG